VARFTLKANAELDLLTQEELRKALGDQWDAEQAAFGRAKKYMEAGGAPPGGPATVGPNAGFVIPESPNSGYVWACRSMGFVLSVAAILLVWKVADPTNTNPNSYVKLLGRGTSNANQPFQFSNIQALVKEGEFIAVSTQGASTLVSWWMAFEQTPEQSMWRLDT
jgi:hypothetical protein